MILQPKALFWLIKLIIRSVQRIAPKIFLNNLIALKLNSVSNRAKPSKALSFWRVPKAFTPRRSSLSFSTYSFDFSGLTRPIANLFAAKVDFATVFFKAATPDIARVTQPAKQIQSKFNETKSAMARPGPGFSVARFFAASPDNARKVVRLAEALLNLKASPEKATKITNDNSHTIVETKKADWIFLRSGLTVEKMGANWPRETPRYWRAISAPVQMPVKVSKPEWQTQTKKNKVSKAVPISGFVAKSENKIPSQLDLFSALDRDPRFISSQNPFKALEDIGDDEFQTPYCRKQQKRKVETGFSPLIEAMTVTSTNVMPPLDKPVPVPNATLLAVDTPILAPVPLTMISPPLTPTIAAKINNNTGNNDQGSPKKSRRQRCRDASTSPSPILKKTPILMPSKDTPESWRQVSSPPRSPSPMNIQSTNTGGEWQQVQRRRRNSRTPNMDVFSNPTLDLGTTPNLAPQRAEYNELGNEETDTMSKLNSPNIVILYKNKKATPV